MPTLPSSRAYSITYCRSPSISKPPSFTPGLSTPDVLAFELNSLDSDDTQNMRLALTARQSSTDSIVSPIEIFPPFSPPVITEDEATTKRGRLRGKSDPILLQAGDKIQTAQAYLRLPSPQEEPSEKEFTSKSERSPSVSLPGDTRKNI